MSDNEKKNFSFITIKILFVNSFNKLKDKIKKRKDKNEKI